MACATIHLAITKRYLENHKALNYEKVIAGTLYPDAVKDNDKSHYTDINRGNDNISHVRSKVNLYAFLKEHSRLNDFELGWFIHLVTDYLFFEECFSEEYLLNNSYEDFCKDLYLLMIVYIFIYRKNIILRKLIIRTIQVSIILENLTKTVFYQKRWLTSL